MSDDLNSKIKQIADLLGQENIPDNLKGLLTLLGAAGGGDAPPRKPPEPVPPPREEKPVRSEFDENMEMVRKMKRVMEKFNARSDPRINLLHAISPFLNATRQKKINTCIRLLQVSSLTTFMDDHEKSGF